MDPVAWIEAYRISKVRYQLSNLGRDYQVLFGVWSVVEEIMIFFSARKR
jgi:hypothetical protein